MVPSIHASRQRLIAARAGAATGSAFLRRVSQPQYRLRVGEIRVYYDVGEAAVEVLAIVTKARAAAWLKEKGVTSEEGGAGEG